MPQSVPEVYVEVCCRNTVFINAPFEAARMGRWTSIEQSKVKVSFMQKINVVLI